jgi:hypothetical protein
VNISHEGSSIVAFLDPWPRTEEESFSPASHGAEWIDYCRSRERKERAAAKTAVSADARRVHQELAEAYASAARQAAEPLMRSGDGSG